MAKSLRSKVKRANRAIKRQKNSKKEIVKMEKMAQQAKEISNELAEKKNYTILGGSPITETIANPEAMAVDGTESDKLHISTKTVDLLGKKYICWISLLS